MTAWELDIRLIIAFLGPSLAFLVWIGQRFFEDRRKQRDSEREKNNLIRALYAEIDFNTSDMEVFLDQSPPTRKLRRAIKANRNLIPHVTDARHTAYYNNLIADLWVISDHLMAKIVLFYGQLEKIRVQVEGLNYPSFQTLSDDGRFFAVDVIRRSSLDALMSGRELLADLEYEYPHLGLHRHVRPEHESLEDLKQRWVNLDTKLVALKY